MIIETGGFTAKAFALVLGAVIYLLVAALGFVATDSSGMLLGLIHNNMADNILHLVTGGASAYVGFVGDKATTLVRA